MAKNPTPREPKKPRGFRPWTPKLKAHPKGGPSISSQEFHMLGGQQHAAYLRAKATVGFQMRPRRAGQIE